MNTRAIWAIYKFEIIRFSGTIVQSLFAPVVSTSLYFIVFGSAIGSKMSDIDGISYGSYLVPGLVMLSVLTESVTNASFAIYMPKFQGTIYEVLSAPVSGFEIVAGYVGAAVSKSMLLGAIILLTARFFVNYSVLHPVGMVLFLFLTSLTFCLFGFIIGIWADGFEKLNVIPLMVITPLTFLGGSFYSITMLPPIWQKISLFNPIVYLISGFRWAFFGTSDIGLALSVSMTFVFMLVCSTCIYWIFRTGYRIKN
jgi:ABC-2 type transport system permease protein